MAPSFVVHASIDRPPADVWASLTNWSAAPQWMNGIDSMSADGPTAVGTTITFHTRGKDRGSSIVACEEGRSVTLRSQQGGVTADYVYSLEAEGEGTRATLAAECTFTGLWTLLGPIIRRAIKSTDGGQMDALKAHVEGG